MRIDAVATNIISIWEHGGRYTSHRNGAYGLIGFQWGNVDNLLRVYLKQPGAESLQHTVDWYGKALMQGNHIVPELDRLAGTEAMKKAQHIAAREYMRRAIAEQKKYYPFATALAQLIICDMGVNNGIWNKYVQDVPNRDAKSELVVISDAMRVRIKAMKDHGIWQKYTGIRRRYNWYIGLVEANADLDMKPFCPVMEVNGMKVNIGDSVEAI